MSGDLVGSRRVLVAATVFGLAVLVGGASWFWSGGGDVSDAQAIASARTADESAHSTSTSASVAAIAPLAEPRDAAVQRAERARAEGLAQAGIPRVEAVSPTKGEVAAAPKSTPPAAPIRVVAAPAAPPLATESHAAALSPPLPTAVTKQPTPAPSVSRQAPQPSSPVIASSKATPEQVVAAVTPKRAGSSRPASVSRPRPERISSPAPVSAREAGASRPATSSVPPRRPPTSSHESSPESRPTPKRSLTPLEQAQAIESAEVAALDGEGGSDVRVLRTSWHPQSDRRSAKIRTGRDGEAITLREGDTVAGLVVQEISPSSVLFEAGGVEIRRRVTSGR